MNCAKCKEPMKFISKMSTETKMESKYLCENCGTKLTFLYEFPESINK